MAKIVATGELVMFKYPYEVRATVEGTDTEIRSVNFEEKIDDEFMPAPQLEDLFNFSMERGPSYPLCAEPETMRRALFVLYEWFGEAESCWIKEPEHVKVDGEIEPMESDPDVIY